jgi:hypothetical protein
MIIVDGGVNGQSNKLHSKFKIADYKLLTDEIVQIHLSKV